LEPSANQKSIMVSGDTPTSSMIEDVEYESDHILSES